MICFVDVADLRSERLNMQVIEISTHKDSGFSTDFFHTLIKQRQILERSNSRTSSFLNSNLTALAARGERTYV